MARKYDLESHHRPGRQSPKATLLYATPNPVRMVHTLFHHEKHGTEIEPMDVPGEDVEWDFVLQLLKEDWCGLLEFPTFVWKFVLPRSLHAQIRVHRHWSFWSQSNQLHDAKDFADKGDYFQIPGLSSEAKRQEQAAMHASQQSYRNLREKGVLPALARGVLPMHVNLGLSASCNLRTLFQVVVERRCHILQGTYWNSLLDQMKAEIEAKVDPRLGQIFDLQPCDVKGACLSPIEEELRIQGKDPHAVCPRYANWKQTGSFCCGKTCSGCMKAAVNEKRPVARSIYK